MKQLTCEMCGGTDLIKQDGVFVCQNCGLKYSVEEAKKMMFGDSAETPKSEPEKQAVSGELENLYELARRAKETGNAANAVKYYEQILPKAPSDWEANFYAMYFTAISTNIAGIESAAELVTKSIRTIYLLIRDNLSDPEERSCAAKEVYEGAKSLFKALSDAAENYHNQIDPAIRDNYRRECLNRQLAADRISTTALKELLAVFADDEPVFSTACVDVLKEYVAYINMSDVRREYIPIIQRYDPSYQPPAPRPSGKPSASEGGCYIATAVYGSYECPQVWTLRRYRDDTLAETWYGRVFIKTYYALSPTLVKWFGRTEWFKNVWRGKLDRMVAKLQANGVESTPYQDKNW